MFRSVLFYMKYDFYFVVAFVTKMQHFAVFLVSQRVYFQRKAGKSTCAQKYSDLSLSHTPYWNTCCLIHSHSSSNRPVFRHSGVTVTVPVCLVALYQLATRPGFVCKKQNSINVGLTNMIIRSAANNSKTKGKFQ